MRVLVTGAKGFVGRNLCESLKAVRDGKDRRPRYAPLLPLEVWVHDRGSSPEDLDAWCAGADFVFNLAGVNRPDDPAEFMEAVSYTHLDVYKRQSPRRAWPRQPTT